MWGGLVDRIVELGLNTVVAKPASNKLKRFLFWTKSHKFYSLLVLIVLLISGVFVYQKVALELNKRAFAQARTTIDTVYADIVAQVGLVGIDVTAFVSVAGLLTSSLRSFPPLQFYKGLLRTIL